MNHVTVDEARALAKRHGIDRMLIVQVNDNGKIAFTSYGKNRQTCQALRELVEDDDWSLGVAAVIHEAQ